VVRGLPLELAERGGRPPSAQSQLLFRHVRGGLPSSNTWKKPLLPHVFSTEICLANGSAEPPPDPCRGDQAPYQHGVPIWPTICTRTRLQSFYVRGPEYGTSLIILRTSHTMVAFWRVGPVGVPYHHQEIAEIGINDKGRGECRAFNLQVSSSAPSRKLSYHDWILASDGAWNVVQHGLVRTVTRGPDYCARSGRLRSCKTRPGSHHSEPVCRDRK